MTKIDFSKTPVTIFFHERTSTSSPMYEFTLKVDGQTFHQLHAASAVDQFGAGPFKILMRAEAELMLQLQTPESERTDVIVDNRK